MCVFTEWRVGSYNPQTQFDIMPTRLRTGKCCSYMNHLAVLLLSSMFKICVSLLAKVLSLFHEVVSSTQTTRARSDFSLEPIPLFDFVGYVQGCRPVMGETG